MASSITVRWHSLWQLLLLLVTLYARVVQLGMRSDLVLKLLSALGQVGLTASSRTLEVVVAALGAVVATAAHTSRYSYNFVAHHWATIGLIAAVWYIIVNHGALLWYKVLPFCASYVRETNFWPWPLRRRSFRRRLYRKYGDAMWAILAFLVFALMLSNSATKPSTTADKWFAQISAQLPAQRAASKQSDDNGLPSNNHFSSPPLQLQASLDTATSDAALGMQRPVEDGSRHAYAANTVSPQQMQPMAPAAKVIFTAVSDVVPGTATALIKAQSRALMLLPSFPTCPANFVFSKTVVEAPHMLVVRPFRIPAMLGVLSAHAVPQLVTQPLPAIALVSSSDAAADQGKPDSTLLGSVHSPNFLELKSWTPLRKLLLAALMFSLGFVTPGLWLWLTGGGDTLAAGAAMAPATSNKPMSLKVDHAGNKAARVLKRSTTSLISTRWTGDHATTPSVLPSPTSPSVQEGQHGLLDADSILPHDASTLTDAAARDQVEDSTSEAPLPAEGGDTPPVRAASHDESAAPAQRSPSLPAPAVELPAAEEPAPVVDCPEQPVPISHEAQAAQPGHEHAAAAQPAPPQPTVAVDPAQHRSASPLQAQSPVTVQPDIGSEPARVPFLADSTPKAALPAAVPQVALPETSPAAVADKHSPNTLSADCSIGDRNGEDKVVSNGCLGFFGCFKRSSRRKRGKAGPRK